MRRMASLVLAIVALALLAPDVAVAIPEGPE